MKAYKGFNNKLQCTPEGKVFQYEIGKEYKENSADLCRRGFHACEAPIDVFNHYAPAGNRFCEVELGDVTVQTADDTKRCGKSIKINAEIGIPGLVKAQIEYVKSRTTFEHTDPKQATAGDSGAATGGLMAATRLSRRLTAAIARGYCGRFRRATVGDRGVLCGCSARY